MGPVMASSNIDAVRADALFISSLQPCDEPGAGQVRRAVAEAISAFGCSGCAGRVAQEFGDHPDTAVARMRWALAVTAEAFADPVPGLGTGVDAGGLLAVRPWLSGRQACAALGARRAGSVASGLG